MEMVETHATSLSAECYTTRNYSSRHERVNSSRLGKFILNFRGELQQSDNSGLARKFKLVYSTLFENSSSSFMFVFFNFF